MSNDYTQGCNDNDGDDGTGLFKGNTIRLDITEPLFKSRQYWNVPYIISQQYLTRTAKPIVCQIVPCYMSVALCIGMHQCQLCCSPFSLEANEIRADNCPPDRVVTADVRSRRRGHHGQDQDHATHKQQLVARDEGQAGQEQARVDQVSRTTTRDGLARYFLRGWLIGERPS